MTTRRRRWNDILISGALLAVAAIVTFYFTYSFPDLRDWVLWVWAGIVGLAVLALSVFTLPGLIIRRRAQKLGASSLTSENLLEAENSVRTGLLQAVGTIFLALGIVVTLTQVTIGRNSAQSQLELARRGQTSERFTTAITQLGNDNVDVRLGGVWAIDRIAADSSEYSATLGQVLSAFVRGKSPRPQDSNGIYQQLTPTYVPLEVRKPDVQAAMTVLGGTNLPGVRISATDLQGVDLTQANLYGMDFTDSYMFNANFRGATGPIGDWSANFTRASLFGANFEDADIGGTNFTEAQLDNSRLLRANLAGSNFRSATLTNANFTDANIAGVDLSGVDLSTCRGISESEYADAVKDEETIPPLEYS